MFRSCYLQFLLFLFVNVVVSRAQIQLRLLNTVYIPIRINPDVFEYQAGTAEQIAIDKQNSILYTVGE